MINQQTFTEIPNRHFVCPCPVSISYSAGTKSVPFPLGDHPFSNFSVYVTGGTGQLISLPDSSHITQAQHINQDSPIKPMNISPRAFPGSHAEGNSPSTNRRHSFRELPPESKPRQRKTDNTKRRTDSLGT